MIRIAAYVIRDLLRSRWTIAYLLFYLLVGLAVLFLSGDVSRSLVTFLQIVLILTPLIGSIFGIMYYYTSRDFMELLLAQPMPRPSIFLGQWLGMGVSLGVSLLVGLGIPFAAYGAFYTADSTPFILLLLLGVVLGFVFTGITLVAGILTDNRIKGFGISLMIWLGLAVLYDGLFLILLMKFRDYPLEKFALAATVLNPIDLSRIILLLQLDISALLGYTGAVFRQFFGTHTGVLVAGGALLFWLLLPMFLIRWVAQKRDF